MRRLWASAKKAAQALDHRLADLVHGVEFGRGVRIAGGDPVHGGEEGLGASP